MISGKRNFTAVVCIFSALTLFNLEAQGETQLPQQIETPTVKETCDFVNLSTACPNIILDIRYATSNNFLGFALYPQPSCYLHRDAAAALIEVQQELSLMNLGIKVFDGYRPLSVQQAMRDAIQDERYVSNPAINKGRHTRGTAVDVTLVDRDGNELEMPTCFDDFSEKAHSDCADVTDAANKNRALLKDVMEKHHFQQLSTEWWHFDFEGWFDDVKFPSQNVPFDELE